MKKIISKVQSAIKKYNMIQDGDNVGVGLSGGKDSLTLLWILNRIRLFYPIKFNIKAITLDPCFHGDFTDYSKITQFCESLGIEHIIKRHPVWAIVFETRQEKNPCSLCSRMRHGILHQICLDSHCNVIALGHNMDDAIETFFMNIFNGGKISVFSPKSYLSRKNLQMIRPLIFCEENEISKFSNKNMFPVCRNLCPKDNNSEREKMKILIQNLENLYPKLRKKILHAIKSSNLNGW